jgi:hypothetical protein
VVPLEYGSTATLLGLGFSIPERMLVSISLWVISWKSIVPAGRPVLAIPGVTMMGIFLHIAGSKSLTALDTEGKDSGVVTTHFVPESNSCLPISSETYVLNAAVEVM